ncbi:uncharacterized protein LOC141972684 [Athene noctua]|uniref:uncharacterized protein LOC141972684 n=1 Tax=Athene noctua TaxID=126797 RepID=UPI003EBEF672
METPEATGATVPLEVSPKLLEPLVTVVATLGELGATPGDVPLPKPPGSLRAGLVALILKICRAMEHRQGEATYLRRALATAGDNWATAGDNWATVATITHKWQESVASVEAAWATIAEDATCLRDACGAVATTGATTGVSKGNLAEAVARENSACRDVLEAARALPTASEWATVAEAVAAHKTRVAEASAGLQAATKATEATVVTMLDAMVARDRGRLVAVAHEPLGRLVAACHGATLFYRHLRRHLEDIETTRHGGPEAPGVAQGGPGGPKDLLAAVAVAEVLWDASARLASVYLLGTLQKVRGLLVTPNATGATTVAQRCREATAALPGLLSQGPR